MHEADSIRTETAEADHVQMEGELLRPGILVSESPLNRAIARALRRLGPLLILMYVVSFLDRANVGFAKQALAASAGLMRPSIRIT